MYFMHSTTDTTMIIMEFMTISVSDIPIHDQDFSFPSYLSIKKSLLPHPDKQLFLIANKQIALFLNSL